MPFATGAGAAVRVASHADDLIDAARVTTVLQDAGKAEDAANLAYRGLAQGEDIAHGLTARAPGLQNVDPVSHVAGLRESPWISTTRDPTIAIEKYGQHGVVEIDLNKVNSEVVDISNGIPGVRGRLSNWARRDREVLIRDHVPAEAIRRMQ